MKYSHSYLCRMYERAGGTFYIFNEDAFKENYLHFKRCMSSHYENSDVAYSMKANYMPIIGRILNDLGGMAEVVSRLEYDIALLNLPGDRVIFNGPVKRRLDIINAISHNSVVNIDSFQEVSFLEELAGNFDNIKVGVRVSFDLPGIQSRFGFSLDDGSYDQCVKRLMAVSNISLVSLHSHFSTKEKSLVDFDSRVLGMRRAYDKLPLKEEVSDINLGGGFFGEMPAGLLSQFPCSVPTISEYAGAIGKSFANCFTGTGVKLIIEPGISVVGNTMDLVVPVIEVRRRHGSAFALLDTSVNVVNPTRSLVKRACYSVSSQSYPVENYERYLLVGNTCMEHDIIDDDFRDTLAYGDFVVFPNRGAYSNNYTPPFIAPPPAILDSNGAILKHTDNVATVLSSYNYI